MNHVTYRRLLAGSFMALSAFSTPGYAQQTLPSMTVEAEKEERGNAPSVLNGTILAPREESAFKAYDGGDYLSLLPGVSAGRMGGHGVEPVIRGQQQTQLNIIQDGAVIHGGCPNRMDPPASFAEPETYDSITVLRGYQSVQYGSGGSGGTVIFERDPVPYEGSTVQSLVDLRAGYETNGSIKAFSADASIGNSLAQIRAIGSFTDAGNYKDGGGQTVRSAFESRSLSLLPVWMPTKETQVSLGLELKETDDALYAGAGMDAPEDENQTIRFSVAHDMDEGQSLKRISFQAYGSFVDHVMDNYSLRPNTGMKMKTESESDTFGGMLSGDFVFGAMPVTAGVDVQHNSRDAKRTSGMLMVTSATTPQSYMWPDVTLQQIGVFVEAEPQVTERSMLRAGMRYDHVKARADAADQVYGMTSPNALYTTYYGGGATSQTEHNLGGLMRFEYDLTSQTNLFAGVSHSVRTADATERYMAAAGSAPWVGNPYLSPEKHRQIDAGIQYRSERWQAAASVFYDDVKDFIMRDTARSQDGILVTNSAATVYRNIDATLAGLETEASVSVSENLDLSAHATWTYGENDEDQDALAQIPPLEGAVSVTYQEDQWSVGSRLNFAFQQSRIDSDTSARDDDKTVGWATVDIFGKYDLSPLTLQVGAKNIFDQDYARHLSRTSAFDPTEVQVNEPGRSFYMELTARF